MKSISGVALAALIQLIVVKCDSEHAEKRSRGTASSTTAPESQRTAAAEVSKVTAEKDNPDLQINIHASQGVSPLLIRQSSRGRSMTEISSVVVAAVLLLAVSCGSTTHEMKSGNETIPNQPDARTEIKSRWEQSCKSLDQKQLGMQYPARKLDLLVKLLEQTLAQWHRGPPPDGWFA
jgi:hypothetical protein